MNIFQGLCICLLTLQVALQSETRQVQTGWVSPLKDVPQNELVTDYESSGLSKVMTTDTLNKRPWRAAHVKNNYLKTAGLTALTGGLAFGTGVVGKKAFAAYKALQQAEKNMEKDPENSDLQKKVARARRKFYAAVFFTLVLGGVTGFVGYKGLLPSVRKTRKMWHDNEILRKPLSSLYYINLRRKQAQKVVGAQQVYQMSEQEMRQSVKSKYRDAFDTLAESFQPTKSTASSEMPSQPAGAGAAAGSSGSLDTSVSLASGGAPSQSAGAGAQAGSPGGLDTSVSLASGGVPSQPVDAGAQAGSSEAQESGRLLTASTPRTTADYKKRLVALFRFTAEHLDPTQYRQKGRPERAGVSVRDPKLFKTQSDTVTRKDSKVAFKKDQKKLRAAADVLDAEQKYNDAITLLNNSQN